ncbi:hypothetical protein VTP01DRAFT_8968 [Rhizomucor pusillus]|uniref:uncharacterized protein n=1 Tax=Rhizomucor pusillus TaxID=4840 RepID=UPI003742B0D5
MNPPSDPSGRVLPFTTEQLAGLDILATACAAVTLLASLSTTAFYIHMWVRHRERADRGAISATKLNAYRALNIVSQVLDAFSCSCLATVGVNLVAVFFFNVKRAGLFTRVYLPFVYYGFILFTVVVGLVCSAIALGKVIRDRTISLRTLRQYNNRFHPDKDYNSGKRQQKTAESNKIRTFHRPHLFQRASCGIPYSTNAFKPASYVCKRFSVVDTFIHGDRVIHRGRKQSSSVASDQNTKKMDNINPRRLQPRPATTTDLDSLYCTCSTPMRRVTVGRSVYRRLSSNLQPRSSSANIESSLYSDDVLSSMILSPESQDEVYLITRFYDEEREQQQDMPAVEEMETYSSPSPSSSSFEEGKSPKVVVDSATV